MDAREGEPDNPRFIYNAYTLLLVIGICVGLVCYNNRDNQPPPVQSER